MYTGPSPTIDGLLWLRLVGMALRHPRIQEQTARAGAPWVIVSCRVRVSDARCPRCALLDPLDDGAPGCRGCGAEIDAGDLTSTGTAQDGMVRLDLEKHRMADGRRCYVTVNVPVSACNDHDTAHVLRLVQVHETAGRIMLTETNLARVDG